MKRPDVVVVDDFLDDPDSIRALALRQKFVPSDWHKGKRSEPCYATVDPASFERLLGRKIDDWKKHGMNARFQICVSGDPIVYHSDLQSHAAVLFLTPNAPLEAGLSLWKSKLTGLRRPDGDAVAVARTYEGNLLDPTKWELADKIGNVYNRLVLWDAQMIHSASCYFGNTLEDGRLFQIFFFDAV